MAERFIPHHVGNKTFFPPDNMDFIATSDGEGSVCLPDCSSISSFAPAANPAEYLPVEVLCRMTSFLDAPALLRLGATNRFYNSLCQQNRSGWEHLCHYEWKTKVHVCEQARLLLLNTQEGASASSASSETLLTKNNDPQMATTTTLTTGLQAFRMAWKDAHDRQFILPSEFTFNANTGKGTIWSFRFKSSAGHDWTAVDPWYQGQPCRQMVCLEDGTVKEYVTAENIDQLFERDSWNRHFPPRSTRTQTTLPNGASLVDPQVPMAWRFLTRPMDLPTRPWGSYVRFTVAGRDVPTYCVRRSPTHNWGFIMESCWGLYASFPLPPRRRHVLRRTPDGVTTWVEDEEEEVGASATDNSNSSEDRQNPTRRFAASRNEEPLRKTRRTSRKRQSRRSDMDSLLADDSSLNITNEVQWREAFLYNVGARVLPEGDDAANQFDSAWAGY